MQIVRRVIFVEVYDEIFIKYATYHKLRCSRFEQALLVDVKTFPKTGHEKLEVILKCCACFLTF